MTRMMQAWSGHLSVAIVVAAATTLSGCASSLVGYSAETSHACTRDEGVGCTPVSDVYKMAMAGKLPGQAAARNDTSPSAIVPVGANLTSSALRPAMSSGIPVRTAPRVLRIWFAPWKDGLDVLHDQRHSYLTLDTGRWLIEHNQERLRREFGPTRLLQGAGSADGGASPQVSPVQRQTRPSGGMPSAGFPELPAQPGAR